MSGRRRKALREAFIAENGRPPYRARVRGGRVIEQDELRPIKKAYVRGRR